MDFVRIHNVYKVKSVQVLLFSFVAHAQICNDEKDIEINKKKYVLLAPTLIPTIQCIRDSHGIAR